jgi:hypothetical protein
LNWKDRAEKWASKLKPFDVPTDVLGRVPKQLQCCKGLQCLHGDRIPKAALTGERRRFLKEAAGNQITRKAYIIGLLDPMSKTSFSIGNGAMPVCWNALCYITGVSKTLLQSVSATPKARLVHYK